MKSYLLLAVSIITLFSSCTRYSYCTEPAIGMKYVPTSSGFLLFTFDTYEKDSKFSKLIRSEQDSAYIDTASSYPRVIAKHTSIDSKFDYIITIATNGRTYRISDISYSGDQKVQADGTISENTTACTRTVNYIINGQKFATEGSTYEIGYSLPEAAVITILQ